MFNFVILVCLGHDNAMASLLDAEEVESNARAPHSNLHRHRSLDIYSAQQISVN